MNKMTELLFTRSMTKRERKEFYKLFRSPVATGKMLGTRTIRNRKDYERAYEKSKVLRDLKNEKYTW